MTQKEAFSIAAVIGGLYVAWNAMNGTQAPNPDAPDQGDAGGASILDSLTAAVGLAGQMTLSPEGAANIQRYESPGGIPNLVGYPDVAGVPTDGWGNTHGAVIGKTISLAQAQADFARNVQEAVDAVNAHVTVPLSQGEFDVLVSFTFNEGTDALRTSHLLSLLNQGDYASVPTQLARWNKAGGRVNAGIINRRNFEIGNWNASQISSPVIEIATGGDGSYDTGGG